MNIAICDDDVAITRSIRAFLSRFQDKFPDLYIEEFNSGENLLAAFKEGIIFEIIFLDIQMSKVNGIQSAIKIKEKYKNVLIIFLTGYSNYVKEAFRLRAFQYLLKPVKKEEVIKEFERALEQYKINHIKYELKMNDRITYLEIHDIQYMEVRNHIIIINTVSEKYMIRGKLQNEEVKLKSCDFIRCHQGFLVNMMWIKSIGEGQII